jgi:hypothetical protein
MYGGIEVQLHALTLEFDGNGQLHALAALAPGKELLVFIG